MDNNLAAGHVKQDYCQEGKSGRFYTEISQPALAGSREAESTPPVPSREADSELVGSTQTVSALPKLSITESAAKIELPSLKNATVPVETQKNSEHSHDVCDDYPPTRNQQDSLESTKLGNTTIHRAYEIAVLTPQGTLKSADFENTFGSDSAATLHQYGVDQIIHNGTATTVNLAAPLHFSDSRGSIDIAKTVTFNTVPQDGKVTLNNITGVSGTSGAVHINLTSLELQPRSSGYLTATARSGWLENKFCAKPDGAVDFARSTEARAEELISTLMDPNADLGNVLKKVHADFAEEQFSNGLAGMESLAEHISQSTGLSMTVHQFRNDAGVYAVYMRYRNSDYEIPITGK